MKTNIITTKLLAILFAGALSVFNAKAQTPWIGGGGSTIESDPSGGNVEITAPYNFSVVGGNASISGSLSSGAITSSGNFSNGSNTLGCGPITSSGNFSCGTHAITCGAITGSGAFSCGSNAVTCGGITSSGNFSNGSNTLGCGAITSTGNFSNGTHAVTCGAITSSGNFSNGSNTLGCGAITSGAITSSGNITTTGVYQISGSTILSQTGGNSNMFIGIGSGGSNTGSYNNAMGLQSLYTNSTGANNCAFGTQALYTNNGSSNSAFGIQTLYNNTSGTHNAAFGGGTMGATTTGSYNTAVGDLALYNNNGSNNTALGYYAGANYAGGSNNTFIGYGTDASSSGLSNATAVGSNAKVYSSNSIELGDNSTAVSIGYSGSALTAQTKFDVLSTGTSLSSGSASYASHSINSNTGPGSLFSQTFITGVYGESSGSSTSAFTINRGGAFNASHGYSCQAVYGLSTPSSSGNISMAGAFNSDFAAAAANGTSYGVYSYVGSNGTLGNIAIYGAAPSSVGNTKPNWAGYFSGDVYVNGNGWVSGTWTVSDKQFKTNINTIQSPTSILKKLKPESYYYDTTNSTGMHFSGKKQYGFIAQDVQQVLPELVSSVTRPAEIDITGKVIHPALTHLGVNYTSFIALLTAALQAEQAKNDTQDSVIAVMQKQISQLLAANGSNNNANSTMAINAQNINLSDADVVVLNQNQPNPFAEQTSITYNIPQSAGTSQILFYDLNGKQIKSVDITGKGKGALNVYASDLSNGMYSYTLVIDGKIIDTKKMVKQQ